ncbi:hypothetical protein Tco_1370707 [Tanacetum coccineum]
MKASEAYKTYHDLATGKVQPKPKYVRRSSRSKTEQAPKPSIGAHEGTSVTPGVPDVPTYEYDDEEISWKTSSDDDDDNEGDDAANDDHDDADNQKETEEESSDPRVHTPSQSEPSDNEENVDVAQSEYTKEEEVNVEHTYEEEDANDLYKDLNVNLEGRDADMTDAPLTTQVIEDTHVTLTPVNPEGHRQSSSLSSGFISNTLNPNPYTGIDSILNTESTSLVEIPVTSVADTTPSFAITLPPPPLPLIQQRTQTPLPIPTTAPSLSEFIQTNQYATTLSSIPNIVDNYLGLKLKEAVDVVVQLKSDRIREEAQAENEDFLNKLDDNIKKIIKDQVKEQVKAQVSKILP